LITPHRKNNKQIFIVRNSDPWAHLTRDFSVFTYQYTFSQNILAVAAKITTFSASFKIANHGTF